MLAEADPTATRFERVGIGRSYLAPNSEAPNGEGVLPTNGESGYARDGVVAMRPGSTISPSIPDNVAHYTMTPTVEKVLGTLKEYFSIRPVSHIVDLFRMCVCGLRPSCNRARATCFACALTRACHWPRRHDADAGGSLGVDEFCSALNMLNLNLSRSDMEEVYGIFDSDGQGGIEVNELFNVLRGENLCATTRRNVSGVAGLTSDVHTASSTAADTYKSTQSLRRQARPHF